MESFKHLSSLLTTSFDRILSFHKPKIQYDCASNMMRHGPHLLYEEIAERMELALDSELPQMEIRFKNLNVTTEVVVVPKGSHRGTADCGSASGSGANTAAAFEEEETGGGGRAPRVQYELPTVANELKKKVPSKKHKKRVAQKEILHNLSGVLRPGTMTLVLGQPGSGKSTFMKVLAGRIHGKNKNSELKVEGTITYNGKSRDQVFQRLPQYVVYAGQRDEHFPTLTVRETLEFAHRCCGTEFPDSLEKLFCHGTPKENDQAIEAAQALFRYYPDLILQQLGLGGCQDTIVGDDMLRGISGGEKKRVTLGEMCFGSNFVLLLDEISTGLDSAATFDIVKTQQSIARNLRKTVVIALLQPTPEVFELFDDVMIFREGQVIYHGPRDQVMQHFQGLGFVCPPRRDFADFLLDMGTEHQTQYIQKSAIRDTRRKVPVTTWDFVDAFHDSDAHDELMELLHEPKIHESNPELDEHIANMPVFHQGFFESTTTLMKRQWAITMRNKPFLKGRVLNVLIMGALYSTTFYQFDPNNIQVVLGILFASIIFLALGQASQIRTFLAAREVFYKQRAANFYRTLPYVVSNSVTQIPLAFLESVVFGSVVYWVAGFEKDVMAYILFLVMLFMTDLAFAAWFFFITNISPNLHVAKPLSMVTVLLYIIFAGFAIPKGDIPDYLIWLYWIDPIAWCLRALAVNQYSLPKFQDVCAPLTPAAARARPPNCLTMGDYLLKLFDIPTEKYWMVYGAIFMLFSYLFFMFLSYLALEYKRYENPHGASAEEEDDDDEYDPEDDVFVTTPKFVMLESMSVKSDYAEASTPIHTAVEIKNCEPAGGAFEPTTLAFQDLWYSVPNPNDPKTSLDLLKGISGYALPGTMTALMGSSGAGKTTLMDVIAGRKTGGEIRGQIMLNGYPATDLAIRRSTGYCEQRDIHSDASTFREALTFSAFLRQGSHVSDELKRNSVLEALSLLNLHPIADKVIRGSSLEQMKRLTIGVELAAQPSVLFLDEPTSGLDARAAKVIMDGVRRVADTGRTVVCTIHQPSYEIFRLFDNLLLLKKGGETVYFGELGKECEGLVKYFEAIPHVEKLKPGYNPATWMLEVIGAGVGNNNNDIKDSKGNGANTNFVQIFDNSKLKKALHDKLSEQGVTRPSATAQELVFTSKRAALESVQMKFVLGRIWDLYWRSPAFNLTRMRMSLFMSIIFGLIYVGMDYSTYTGINAGMGLIFMTSAFLGLVAFTSVLPTMCEERPAFYRERACETYNALWYFVGFTLAEIPYVMVSTLVFAAVFFPFVGFTGFANWCLYWLNMSLHLLLHTYIGQLFGFVLPSLEVASVLGMLLNSIYFLFMGYNPPTDEIPKGYKWIYYITPQTYTFASLSSIVFGECPEPGGSQLGCKILSGNVPPQYHGMTVKQFVETVFGVKRDDMWWNTGATLVFMVFFRLLALLAIRYVNTQKR